MYATNKQFNISQKRNIREKIFLSRFHSLQYAESMKFLKTCNKTAVLAYEPNIKDYEMKLKRAGLTKISIGNDDLPAINIGLNLQGWFPRFILKRFRGIGQSGIFSYWNKIVVGHTLRLNNLVSSNADTINTSIPNISNQEIRTKLSGNLVVIFVVFLTGCSLGLCIFILELAWGTVKKILLVGVLQLFKSNT